MCNYTDKDIENLQGNIEFVNDKVDKSVDVLKKVNTKIDEVWGEVKKMNDINSSFNEKVLEFMERTKTKSTYQEEVLVELISLSKKMSERIFDIQDIVDTLSNLNGIPSDISTKILFNKEEVNKITLDMDAILDKINIVGIESLTEKEKDFLKQ